MLRLLSDENLSILATLKETPLAKAEIFIKAVEVEAGLALPADVTIKLSRSTE